MAIHLSLYSHLNRILFYYGDIQNVVIFNTITVQNNVTLS